MAPSDRQRAEPDKANANIESLEKSAHSDRAQKSSEPFASPPTPDRAYYESTPLGKIDQTWFQNIHIKRVLIGLFALVLIVPSVQFCVRITQTESSPYREKRERHKSALGRWLPTAEMMGDADRDDPYGYGHWFPLPPFILMCLYPLSKMGFLAPGIFWALMKLAGLLAGFVLLLRAIRWRDFAVPIGVLVLAGVFGLRPVIADLQHGNVNLFVLIGLMFTWACYVQRRDLLAGLFLSLTIVTKITPALALIYFAYKRAWRVCIAAGLGLVLVFGVIPSLWVGFGENIALHQSWYDMLVRPFTAQGYTVIEDANQSLYGVVVRLLDSSGVITAERMPLEDAHAAGILGMARPTGFLGVVLRPLISLSVLGALAWACRTPTHERRDVRLLLEISMVAMAMLLLSERTWKHHATMLLFAYLALWYALACFPWPRKSGDRLAALLAAQLLLLVGTTSGIWGDYLADELLHFGVFCLGLLLCFGQCGYMIRRMSRPDFGLRPNAAAARSESSTANTVAPPRGTSAGPVSTSEPVTTTPHKRS